MDRRYSPGANARRPDTHREQVRIWPDVAPISQHYDVIAKLPPNTSRAEQFLMLQSLLADRFKVGVHSEMRDLNVYALVVSSKGAKLHEVEKPERPARPLDNGNPSARRFGGKISMGDLCLFLGGGPSGLDRPVVDMTGLTGYYDVTLEWSQDETQPRPAEPDTASAAVPLPSLFQALEQQLGLRLEPRKNPAKVIVVDHFDPVPAENRP